MTYIDISYDGKIGVFANKCLGTEGSNAIRVPNWRRTTKAKTYNFL